MMKIATRQEAAGHNVPRPTTSDPSRRRVRMRPQKVLASGLKLLVAFLIAGMNWTGLVAVGTTLAYYSDDEASSENALGAGSLDFSLDADEWSPVETAGALEPGDSVTRHMSVLAGDSIPFQYKVKTVQTAGDDDFCDALDLVATREGDELYNGGLMGFDLAPSVEIEGDGVDDWTFTVTLPGGSGPFDGVSCEFRFDVDGWQIGFPDGSSGFSDHEELENILESGVAEEGLDNISPIADSYVDQNNPDNNHGDDHDLKVRSQSGEKNKRSFIRFDFHFPDDTSIQSAALKLFLDKAPSASRTYALSRSLSPWSEDDVTWDNQPATSSPARDSAITGTTNDVWLSWNVTDDVADFVDETFSNDGWGLFDTAENSATSREGKFISRNDSDNEGQRPVLEVAFSAPPAATTHLVINEVYYDVGSGKGSEGTNEWVELYNPTGAAVDVKDWQICDALSCDTLATTSPSILIPSHEFAVITPNASTWTHWELPDGAVEIVIGSNIGGGLANAGDAVILKDASSVEIDAMSYGSNTSKLNPAVPTSSEGNSLARIIKGYDADSADDWIINATPNPGTNPSDSGAEIIRFTSQGAEVADLAHGLDALPQTDADAGEPEAPDETAPEEGIVEGHEPSLAEIVTLLEGTTGNESEPAPEENATTTESGADEFATSTPDTLGAAATPDGSQAAEIGEDSGAEAIESPDVKFDEEEASVVAVPIEEDAPDADPPAETGTPAENPAGEPASPLESEPVVEPAPELEQASESAPAPEPPPAPEPAPSSEHSGEAAPGE